MATRNQKKIAKANIHNMPEVSSHNNSATRERSFSLMKIIRTPEFSIIKTIEGPQPQIVRKIDTIIEQPSVKPAFFSINEEAPQSLAKDSAWLDIFCRSNFFLSKPGVNSSLRRTPVVYREPGLIDISSITPFDDIEAQLNLRQSDEEEEAANMSNKKRKTGSSKMNLEDKRNGVTSQTTGVKSSINGDSKNKGDLEPNFMVVPEDQVGFLSDGDEQSLYMAEQEIIEFDECPSDATINLVFGAHCPMKPRTDESKSLGKRVPNGLRSSRKPCCMKNLMQSGDTPFSLNINKLIGSINKAQENEILSRQFICKFCGKIFAKPSSLGGHTAKTHNGLSMKYKNRVQAAKSRKVERDRIKFLRQAIALKMGS